MYYVIVYLAYHNMLGNIRVQTFACPEEYSTQMFPRSCSPAITASSSLGKAFLLTVPSIMLRTIPTIGESL